MKEFHFTKKYFKKTIFNDPETNVRVEISETPSIDISEEEYSLRISTRHTEEREIHRRYAIEHHLMQEKHRTPHLQFKFHTEKIGTFRIFLDIENSEEYKKAILGFIYKIKDVLKNIERHHPGITEELLVMELVSKLKKEEEFLKEKLTESINNKKVGFDEISEESMISIKNNSLLSEFLGERNINKLAEFTHTKER